MPDAELRYSLNAVKRAGKFLRDGCSSWDQLIDAEEIFENWQACHSYPMTRFYESLSQCARTLSRLTNVVQRRKRMDAIIAKLKKYPQMQLTTMQDIAGCRAIVKEAHEIDALIAVCKQQWLNHKLYDNSDDYMARPQPTGYRGIHLIYKFQSDDKSFDGRFVEVQFRSRWQHAWATAVETIDLFQKQTLKAGTGDPKWQRFFALMGSAIAKLENTAPVPETPTSDVELHKELRYYAELLQVDQLMMAYGALDRSVRLSGTGMDHLWTADTAQSGYFVMEMEPDLKTVQVRGYHPDQVQAAYSDVAETERAALQVGRENVNVVLVAASDYEKLKDAYPNWIIDTHNFRMLLRITLGEVDRDAWFG
jgi:ppGpp synthetase/RelA/SpoT-type nucleotidyltranferase